MTECVPYPSWTFPRVALVGMGVGAQVKKQREQCRDCTRSGIKGWRAGPGVRNGGGRKLSDSEYPLKVEPPGSAGESHVGHEAKEESGRAPSPGAWAPRSCMLKHWAVRPGPRPGRPRTFHDEVRLTLAAVGHDLVAPLILHRHFREDEDVTLPILLEAVSGLEGVLPSQFHAIFQPGGRGK